MTRREEQNDKLYSIYRYTDPRDQEIIYIGSTNDSDRRHREHISKNGLLYPLAQELAGEGLQLIFDILETTIGIKNAFGLEKKYIKQHQPRFNIMHNSAVVHANNKIKKYREEIADAVQLYHFTYDEALLWHYEFSFSEARENWYTYQTIRNTAIVTAKKLQGEANFTESELLDIALEATDFYEKKGPMWEEFMESLRRKGGVEGE